MRFAIQADIGAKIGTHSSATAEDVPSIWYMNTNPIITDISYPCIKAE